MARRRQAVDVHLSGRTQLRAHLDADAAELFARGRAIRTRDACAIGRERISDGLLDQLYAAIRELPELDRSLVLLSLDGLPYKEIAEILGLSETNVGARLTRARAQLTDKLREQEQ